MNKCPNCNAELTKEQIVEMLPEHLQDAAKRLIVYNQDDEHVAAAIWCEEDVFTKAKERGLKITREQAQEIFAKMDNNQDCELGITWTTIDVYLDEIEAECEHEEVKEDVG